MLVLRTTNCIALVLYDRAFGWREEPPSHWPHHQLLECPVGGCWRQRASVQGLLRPSGWRRDAHGKLTIRPQASKKNVFFVTAQPCWEPRFVFLQTQVSGNTYRTVLKNLDSNTEYTVTVVPVYSAGEGQPMSENGKTCKCCMQAPGLQSIKIKRGFPKCRAKMECWGVTWHTGGLCFLSCDYLEKKAKKQNCWLGLNFLLTKCKPHWGKTGILLFSLRLILLFAGSPSVVCSTLMGRATINGHLIGCVYNYTQQYMNKCNIDW